MMNRIIELSPFDFPEYEPLMNRYEDENESLLQISNCVYTNKSIPISSRLRKIIFLQVHFTEKINFKFLSSFDSVRFVKCTFEKCNNLLDINFRLELYQCIFIDCLNIGVSHYKSLEIVECNTKGHVTISCGDVDRVDINNSSLKELTIVGSSKSKINTLSFFSHVESNLLIENLNIISNSNISCEPLHGSNEKEILKPFGSIEIRNIHALNALAIKDLYDANTIENPINKITLNFSEETEPSRMDVQMLNCEEVEFFGVNNSTNIMLVDLSVKKISLNQYVQKGKGEITIAQIKNEIGEFTVDNSRITNSEFYFQNVQMGRWSARIHASLFKYHSLAFTRPLFTKSWDEKRDLQIDLDTYNTWLLNTDKDGDIINYHDLKKEQWKVLWKKRKKDRNGLSTSELLQYLAQLSNDFGTSWLRALGILLFINTILSALLTYSQISWFNLLNPLSIITIFSSDIWTHLSPIARPVDYIYWPGHALIPLYLVKVLNTVLIVQMVSAFRVYFKR